MDYIQNRTFDEIAVGETARLTRTLGRDDILLFAAMSGDVNPAHVDEEFARSDLFQKVIGHGMWGGALISTVLGTMLPGPGTIYCSQTLRFRRPVSIGDTVTVAVVAREKVEGKFRVVFDCECTNQSGEVVISGNAEVIAPREKIKRPRMAVPEVRVHDQFARYRELMQLAAGLAPIRVGVVHPVDADTLRGVAEAAAASLIVPVLVGPAPRIRAAAQAEGIDIGGFEIVSTEHRNAAAATAVALARAGSLDALMKGALDDDELMQPVTDPASGLGTGRRPSHVYAIDVPAHPRALLLTDAALNAHPRLADKRDIVQNAINLMHAIGRPQPKVAILSSRDRIDPQVASTLDAAALCKMAELGQITGGIVDGPLTFGAAVSGARGEARQSPVAGQADILVVPDVEGGQMLVQQLEHLAGARAAGLVLGARVPVVLPEPRDSAPERAAACALALLLAQARKSRIDQEAREPGVPG